MHSLHTYTLYMHSLHTCIHTDDLDTIMTQPFYHRVIAPVRNYFGTVLEHDV